MKIVIIYRPGSQAAIDKSDELKIWLEKKNIEVYCHPQQNLKNCKTLNDLSQANLVIAMGGDGTYLEAVRLCMGHQIPILGINMGSLGFLTVSPVENLYEIVEKAILNQLESRPRSMLQAEVNGQAFQALNDIVFERGELSQLLFLRIKTGDQLISDLKADGLIFSTPTGTTAYNLAAGGPILHPEVKAYVMTPICPHSLTNRPTVFSDEQELQVELLNVQQEARITVDGQMKIKISKGQIVKIKKAAYQHNVLRIPSHNYFDLLRKKLKFGERA
ncbi:MAG: NAD(+)/NADH kinase [Bdellovibrionaceae bacterium]|nr:NAD(+)/NADH kinase [Pseudobdellovibrionaceae bacterium]